MVAPLASRELRRLQTEGFVDPGRRRVRRARGRGRPITAKGRDAYRRLRAASVAAAVDALADWKASELTELAHMLGRLADDFSAARV